MSYLYHNKKIFETYIINNNYNWVIIEHYEGHTSNFGCKKGTKNINPYFIVIDVDNGKEFIAMYIKDNCYTLLNIEDIDKIKEQNTSWFLCNNGYIASNINCNQIYLHQYIMNYWGQGKGQLSIDHINRNKLDNRRDNLRITSQSIQNSNKDKANRKENAQDLPEGITQNMLPKYVYYCTEILNKNKPNQYTREFFRIEKHPKLNKKCISSSKSIKVTAIEKLKQVIEIINKLENNIDIENENKLPKYISIINHKNDINKKHLLYERRIDNQRQSMKMTFNTDNEINDILKLFSEKVFEKYNYQILE